MIAAARADLGLQKGSGTADIPLLKSGAARLAGMLMFVRTFDERYIQRLRQERGQYVDLFKLLHNP